MKRFICILMFCTICIVGCGIKNKDNAETQNNNEKSNSEGSDSGSRDEQILKYMKDKYGKEFKIDGIRTNDEKTGYRTTGYEIFVSCEGFENGEVVAGIYTMEGSSDKFFRDNLINIRFENDIKNYVGEKVRSVFKEAVVNTDVRMETCPHSDSKKDLNFEEFLKCKAEGINVLAVTKESLYESDEQFESAFKAVKEEYGGGVSIWFLVISDSDYDDKSNIGVDNNKAYDEFKRDGNYVRYVVTRLGENNEVVIHDMD